MNVLIVGDSIALGATEVFGTEIVRRAPQSYVDLLRRSRPDWTITLDAAVRRTTRDAIAALPALLDTHRPTFALLAMGGNDADIDWKRYIVSRGTRIRHNVPVETFAANLRTFCAISRASGATPMLSDLPGGDTLGRGRWLTAGANGIDVSAMIDASGGEAESLRRLATYRDAVETVAREEAVTIARWAAAFEGLPLADRYGADSLHPGDAAHAIIARTIEAAVSGPLAPVPGERARVRG